MILISANIVKVILTIAKGNESSGGVLCLNELKDPLMWVMVKRDERVGPGTGGLAPQQ